MGILKHMKLRIISCGRSALGWVSETRFRVPSSKKKFAHATLVHVPMFRSFHFTSSDVQFWSICFFASSHVLAAYASFLWEIDDDEEEDSSSTQAPLFLGAMTPANAQLLHQATDLTA